MRRGMCAGLRQAADYVAAVLPGADARRVASKLRSDAMKMDPPLPGARLDESTEPS